MAEEFDTDAPDQFRDMDNNGIRDVLQPNMQPAADSGYQYKDSYDVSQENVSGASYARNQREGTGHVVATYDTPENGARDPSRSARVDEQNVGARDLEIKTDADPTSAMRRPNFEKTVQELDGLRKKEAIGKNKSSFSREIASNKAHKEDKSHGAEMLTEFFTGLKAGVKHGRQQNAERALERHNLEQDGIRLRMANDADLQAHEESLLKVADARGSATTIDGVAKAEAGPSKDGGNDGGPGGDGGPSGGTGGKPASEAQTTAEAGAGKTVEQVAKDNVAESAVTAAAKDGVVRDPAQVAGNDIGKEAPAAAAAEKQPEAKGAQVAPSAAIGREVDGGEAMGSAGIGAAVAVVNPVAGVAATAIKTQSAQKEAGADHASDSKTLSKGPTPKEGHALPGRPQRTSVTFSPGQPSRRMTDTPKEMGRPDQNGVVRVPLRPVRAGGLHAQAATLSRPSAPSISMGASKPVAPQRALGMGLGANLAKMMATQQAAVRDDGPSVAEQAAEMRRRSGGMSR